MNNSATHPPHPAYEPGKHWAIGVAERHRYIAIAVVSRFGVIEVQRIDRQRSRSTVTGRLIESVRALAHGYDVSRIVFEHRSERANHLDNGDFEIVRMVTARAVEYFVGKGATQKQMYAMLVRLYPTLWRWAAIKPGIREIAFSDRRKLVVLNAVAIGIAGIEPDETGDLHRAANPSPYEPMF